MLVPKPAPFLGAVLALGASLVVSPCPLGAGTIIVPMDVPTIQQGIDLAEDGDLILVAPGTYVGTIDFTGKSITLRSTDGPEMTIIDGDGQGSVVTFASGEGPDSVIEGFTIQNGFVGPLSGGGIHCGGSSPTIRGNLITGNVSAEGGGVYCAGSSAVIEGNTIANNSSAYGGGITCVADSSPSILNNLISENEGSLCGGGLCVDGSGPDIVGNTIRENCGAGGGLIIRNASSPHLLNNLIRGNQGPTGGGMQIIDSFVVIENVTMVENFADVADIMAIYGTSTVVLRNSIVFNSGSIEVAPGGVTEFSYSVVADGMAVWPGPGNIWADPLWIPGPLGDFYLSHVEAGQVEESPCVDAGDPSSSLFPATTRTDEVVDAVTIDMGFRYPSSALNLVRGDCNGDHLLDISDAVGALASLFLSAGTRPNCVDACDAQDDGLFDISDPIYVLAHLFVPGSPPPPLPFPDCGGDPTSGDLLDCRVAPSCP